MQVGERIAFYRQRRGYTQSQLAGLVGRSTDWLSNHRLPIRAGRDSAADRDEQRGTRSSTGSSSLLICSGTTQDLCKLAVGIPSVFGTSRADVGVRMEQGLSPGMESCDYPLRSARLVRVTLHEPGPPVSGVVTLEQDDSQLRHHVQQFG